LQKHNRGVKAPVALASGAAGTAHRDEEERAMATVTTESGIELELPDTSDLDLMVGLPVAAPQYTDPISRRDIRRFVEAMSNPNPLHFNARFAAESHFGEVVAPQSMLVGGTVKPHGIIPNAHSLFVESETWHYGPRIFSGDGVAVDQMIYGYEIKNLPSLGPAVFQRSGITVVTAPRCEFVYKRRQTSARYLIANAQKLGGVGVPQAEPAWTPEKLAEIERQKLDYVDSLIGHENRLFGDVAVGDELPLKVHGPHTVQSFTWEAAARLGVIGGVTENLGLPSRWGGLMNEMMPDAEAVRKNPAAGNAFLYGGGRGHLDPAFAERIGVGKRGYGFGDSLETWCTDLLANWAGEWGFVRRIRCQYRYPALTGDVSYVRGKVTEKWMNERSGAATVRVEFEMTNQDGKVQTRGFGEIELPAERWAR
jgi:acyl dehydratase